MAIETRTIGTTGRNYSTITSWEAAIDNTTYPSAGTDVLGECYDDSVFDESVLINAVATNVDSITLSVATGERHDGTAGTGARIVHTSDKAVPINISVANTDVEWLEVDGNGFKANGIGIDGSDGVHNGTIRLCIVHSLDKDGGTVRADGIIARSNVVNNIIYDIQLSTGTSTTARGISADYGSAVNVSNNTVHDIRGNVSTNSVIVINLRNDADTTVQNNIATNPNGAGSGTQVCYSLESPPLSTMDHNLASDTTASGTGSIDSAVTADQFVSITGGSEDLHLKSGADAIDAGTDLGVVPAGVEIDIDGWNRDSDTPSRDPWDMGAHEFEPPPVGGNEGAAMYHHLQNIGAY